MPSCYKTIYRKITSHRNKHTHTFTFRTKQALKKKKNVPSTSSCYVIVWTGKKISKIAILK